MCSSMANLRNRRMPPALCVLAWLALLQYIDARYVRPEDCTWEPIPEATGVSMSCRIRTLQAGPTPTNFSLIMGGHTLQLAVICDDVVSSSALTNSSFEHLTGLQQLLIDKCKLDQLPVNAFKGLSDLKQLTIRTFSPDRGRFALHLPPSALAPLKQIEEMDFSWSNINVLSQGLFCGLEQLRVVNLSHNAFQDVYSLGFSSDSHCRPGIRELTVTHNRLRVLSNRGFSSLIHLDQLHLQASKIGRIEPDALNGLTQLSVLDISHNSIFSLPSTLFKSTAMLSELYVRNNSITALPAGLFNGLFELTVLDLAHNQLAGLGWLPTTERAAVLSKLTVLDLSHNKLTRIDSRVFAALKSLQTLQLQNNLIEFVGDDAFDQLENLQSLVLSFNRLKQLGPRVISGLENVMAVHLDHNEISSIDDAAFANMSMLQELNLASNALTRVPQTNNLSGVRSLDLSDNAIERLTNDSFEGLTQLYAFNLMGNKVGNLSKGVLNHLPSVRILNLADNGIQSIQEGTFDSVARLHYLRLDSNGIEDANGLFSNLHDLTMLNMSANQLRSFDYALIPIGLQWLDIHSNEIEALGNYFHLEDSHRLRTLDASFNRLTELDTSALPMGIEIVLLNNNEIRFIHPSTFAHRRNLSRVDLTYNKLGTVEAASFRITEVPTHRPLPEFAISGNPFKCDCNLEWMQQFHDPSGNGALQSRQVPRLVDLLKVECEVTFSKGVRVMPLVKVDSAQFLCPYKRHCFSHCHCCDFAACDCEMVCPDNCTCFHDTTWRTNVIDCSARNHSQNPLRLPMEVTEVYLDGNEMTELNAMSFMGRKQMQILFLNQSGIERIENQTFSGLYNLRVLRLENNQLTRLEGHEFDDLDQLTHLYLSYNKIQYIHNTTFVRLRNLEMLHIDHNALTEISVWGFQYNQRLIDLRLADNPWTCECQFTVDFTQFLFNEHGNTVRDIFQLTCVYNETKTLAVWELNVTECYNLAEATTFVRPFYMRQMEDLLVLTITLLVVIIFVALIVAAVVVYRRRLSVWFYSRYGLRMFQRTPVEEEKLFDAFVSYSKKDEAFVAQILAPELECGNPPYRLCLHYRDLSMAGGYLSEAIQEAVESSRRTIVVLSEHFLKSEWCRYEFKSAHYEVLNNSSHKLVVIFLGRVSYRELDSDIRMWLKDSTFLHWGEKNFWDKLRYSLPDARHRKILRSDLNSIAVHI